MDCENGPWRIPASPPDFGTGAPPLNGGLRSRVTTWGGGVIFVEKQCIQIGAMKRNLSPMKLSGHPA